MSGPTGVDLNGLIAKVIEERGWCHTHSDDNLLDLFRAIDALEKGMQTLAQWADPNTGRHARASLHDEAMALLAKHGVEQTPITSMAQLREMVGQHGPRRMVFADLIHPTCDEWLEWPYAYAEL